MPHTGRSQYPSKIGTVGEAFIGFPGHWLAGATTDHVDGFTFRSAATSARIDFGRLINDLVGAGEDRRRDGKAERSRGIEIDGQPEFTGRLDRQIGGPLRILST